VEDWKAQVENLKSALRSLDQKLHEANAKANLLIAQHRRNFLSKTEPRLAAVEKEDRIGQLLTELKVRRRA
jgi:hypothetical protein